MVVAAVAGSWEPEPGRVLDGFDQWPALTSGGAVASPRTSALISYWGAFYATFSGWKVVVSAAKDSEDEDEI